MKQQDSSEEAMMMAATNISNQTHKYKKYI